MTDSKKSSNSYLTFILFLVLFIIAFLICIIAFTMSNVDTLPITFLTAILVILSFAALWYSLRTVSTLDAIFNSLEKTKQYSRNISIIMKWQVGVNLSRTLTYPVTHFEINTLNSELKQLSSTHSSEFHFKVTSTDVTFTYVLKLEDEVRNSISKCAKDDFRELIITDLNFYSLL